MELTTHDYGRGDALAYLSRFEVDFAVFPPNRLLVRREKGEPLVGIAAVNQTGLETIQAIRSAGISRPRDLAGHRVGYGPTPREGAMVRYPGGRGRGRSVADRDRGFQRAHELTPGLSRLQRRLNAIFGGYWCWDVLSRGVPEDDLITWRVSDIGAPAPARWSIRTAAAV